MIYTSLWKACYLCPGARPHLQAWKVQAEVLCDLAILFILFGMSVGMVMEDSPSLLFATFFKFKLKKNSPPGSSNPRRIGPQLVLGRFWSRAPWSRPGSMESKASTRVCSAAPPGSLLEQNTWPCLPHETLCPLSSTTFMGKSPINESNGI